MKIAFTGGTGFVRRNIARLLAAEHDELVLIARRLDQTRKGLPAPGPITWRQLRSGSRYRASPERRHSKRVFFEMP